MHEGQFYSCVGELGKPYITSKGRIKGQNVKFLKYTVKIIMSMKNPHKSKNTKCVCVYVCVKKKKRKGKNERKKAYIFSVLA